MFYAGRLSADETAEDYLFEREPRRHALVIGNAQYSNLAPMPSANVDQLQVVNCLRALNFDVMDTSVLKSVRAFEDDVLPAFRRKIDPGDIVVFYFSGHGFSYGPHNFIAPLELPSRVKENDLLDVAIALENVESVIAARRPGIVVVIIDACRTIGPSLLPTHAIRTKCQSRWKRQGSLTTV